MTFSVDELEKLLSVHQQVARVVIARVKGSSPREVGASMWVYPQGQLGTIGGGAMEFAAMAEAQAMLQGAGTRLHRFSLGPSLGQCCGGAVELLIELFDHARLAALSSQKLYMRKCDADIVADADQFPDVKDIASPTIHDGWFIERINMPKREIWLYGAGHVARAIVHHIQPFNQFSVTWVDHAQERFPNKIPSNMRQLIAKNPADLVRYAPSHAEHVIMTHSHPLDLDICHQILSQKSRFLGLIGSQTKLARFRKRLGGLGHSTENIARLKSPIGTIALGKSPHAIALGVVSDLLLSNVKQQPTLQLVQRIKDME